MTDLFRDPSAGWAALLIVVLPLVIIGTGEIDERLRQRDSPFRSAVSILRVWVVPLVSIWVLTRALFSPADDNFFLRAIGSALVLALGVAALSALAVVVGWLGERGRDGQRAIPRLLLALPRLGVILVTAWFLIAGVWAVDLSAALTALGVTSLVVSFALQDTLSGIASGFLLLADQPFKPGDWIKVGDLEGRVVDTNWRSSRILTRDGDLEIVPNGNLAGASITNFDEPARLHRVVVDLQVAYLNAPTAAKEMLLDTARSTPGVLRDPAPDVRIVQIDDPLMGYQVHMWVDDYAIAPQVKSDFGTLVWYHSHRHEVPLPSPAQDLYLYDGVQASLSEKVDRPELRRRIADTPPFDELPDDDLDRLSAAADAAFFARDETVLVESNEHDLHILYRGRARLVLRDRNGIDTTVVELDAGELFGLLDHPDESTLRPLVVATTDCEIVQIKAEAAGAVISRTTALANALDQLAATRRRRIGRVLRRLQAAEERAVAIDASSPDAPAENGAPVGERPVADDDRTADE